MPALLTLVSLLKKKVECRLDSVRLLPTDNEMLFEMFNYNIEAASKAYELPLYFSLCRYQ